MGEGVHTGVRAKLGGHGVGELGVHDGHVGRDLEVGNRELDALGVVGDDREGRDLGGGTGGRGDGAEVGLGAKLRKAEDLAHILKGGLGVLVLDPHGLRGIDGRATAEGDDPVGLELGHHGSAVHHGLDGRVGLDALDELDLEAGLLEVRLDILQEAAAAHGAATRDDDGALTLEVLDLVAGALTKVQVARVGKTSHMCLQTQASLGLITHETAHSAPLGPP